MTETMYVYYIAMKIYVFDGRNIFSSFYCLCITICLPILLSWIKHKHQPLSKQKPFKIKTSIPFTILFYQTLHSYNNFVQVKVFLKVTNTHLYTIQNETSQEIS
jgi:hypothetical protein